MAHVAFPQRSKLITLPSGHSYSYVKISPTESSTPKPTILFLHGFPSSCFDWRHQITYFSSRGYGILAPDLLGYGQSSKPLDPAAYNCKHMAHDIAALLDAEGLGKVHGVAHDFGSTLLSRLYTYFPQKLLSCAFLSVPYTPPGSRFDMEAVNAFSMETLGYMKYGYMSFMKADDSWKLLSEHKDSFTTIMYGLPSQTSHLFYPPNALSASLHAQTIVPLPPYLTPTDQAIHYTIFSSPDAYRAPTIWYRVLMDNLSADEEAADAKDPNIHVPVLMVVEGKGDATVEMRAQATEMFAKGTFKCVRVDGDSHWVQLQCADEVNERLEEHFDGVER
ncbi:MAG: hypothetical protein Q9227_008469 [Pyrenula ochraceoflavens]